MVGSKAALARAPVERFFVFLTDKKIRRGIHRSVAALGTDIASFIERHNAGPKPFRWAKIAIADDILAFIEHFYRYNAPAVRGAILRTQSIPSDAAHW